MFGKLAKLRYYRRWPVIGIWHVPRDTATVSHAGPWRPWLGFLRHFGEMVLAMMLGMILLGMPSGAIMGAIGYSDTTQRFPELSALVMTFNMTVPMAAWMRFRGMQWRPIAEMSGAMVVPAIAIVVLSLFGLISNSNLSGTVMDPMLPEMLAVMLYRRADYLHGGMRHHVASGPLELAS